MALNRLGSSFRDPSGFMYLEDGVLLRHVTRHYSANYDRLMRSGLYSDLLERRWVVPHVEVDLSGATDAYATLRPEVVPYVSYPYEWCFSQLKSAALLTLDIQLLCLRYEMVLKDASAFNVQFVGTRPVFIDTLSFATYETGNPWVAYRQFCEHFLGPLALMSYRDVRLRHLFVRYLDGVPLDLVSNLLPMRTMLTYGLLAHIHLHARSQRRHRDDARSSEPVKIPSLPKAHLVALTESLRAAVASLRPPSRQTEWSDYYDETNYSKQAMGAKETLVKRLVDEHFGDACLIHDLGSNTGRFSRLVASPRRYVVSHDIDDLAVERNFNETARLEANSVLPLILDLTNPSPPIGWALAERQSALERMAGGSMLGLAIGHHLAISNNVPLSYLGMFFSRMTDRLIIEFIPKEDSQVRRLLATREDVFPDYTEEVFVEEFSRHFEILGRHCLPDSARMLFSMRKRTSLTSAL